MFWSGAKALTQQGVTALERLDYLEIFRIQLLHLKMNKVNSKVIRDFTLRKGLQNFDSLVSPTIYTADFADCTLFFRNIY